MRWGATLWREPNERTSPVTIQDIGSIGELVAAIATIATIAYLAIQIRESTRASRASTADRSSAAVNQVNTMVFQDAQLTALWFQGLREYEALPPAQQEQFDLVAASYLTVLRNDFALSAEGLLPAGLEASHRAQITWYASQQGFALHYWPKYRGIWPPEFATAVDRAIELGKPAAQQSAAADSA